MTSPVTTAASTFKFGKYALNRCFSGGVIGRPPRPLADPIAKGGAPVLLGPASGAANGGQFRLGKFQWGVRRGGAGAAPMEAEALDEKPPNSNLQTPKKPQRPKPKVFAF